MSSRPSVVGRAQVLVGDTTTHGGTVISGSPNFTVGGIPVARVGDMVTCPLCKPHLFPIVEGQPNALDQGRPLALAGHTVGCGAKLIAVAAGATAPAPAGSSGSAGGQQPNTGLGQSVDELVAKSPTLTKNLDELRAAGYQIRFGTPGGGSSIRGKIITLDPNLKQNPKALVQTLAHEVGHAKHPKAIDTRSRQEFLNSMLDDEGAATLMNIQVQREIKANGGPDIGIAGNTGNHAKYNAIYDTYQRTGDRAKAIRDIGQVFGQGEKTSTTGQAYEQYYGGWYDQHYTKP